jgi:conjugal transfer pilus assembly protein TraI
MSRKLISLFRRVFMEPVPESAVEAVKQGAPDKPVRPHVPIYPPEDRGIAFVGVDALMDSQHDLIRRIRLLAGVMDGEFEEMYLRPIRNAAAYIDALPATEHGHHNGAGGLFRLVLELSFYSMQAAEGVIFSAREGVEIRRELAPRWRYSTFLAGLCCELHRVIREMLVVSPSGAEWPVHRTSLSSWLKEVKEDHYYVKWVKESIHGYGSTSILVTKIVPDSCMQYIQQGSLHILPAMLDVISGSPRPSDEAVLYDIIKSVRDKVIEKDCSMSVTRYGRLTVGSHMEPHILDAMRNLTKNGKWEINKGKARLWYGNDGLFLVWKTAAKEIIEYFRAEKIQGMPQDAATLLDTLCKNGVFEDNKDGNPFWTIAPPEAKNELLAVKFSNTDTLLGSLDDAPEKVGNLVKGAVQSPAPVVPPQMPAADAASPIHIAKTSSAAQEVAHSSTATHQEIESKEESAEPAKEVTDVVQRDAACNLPAELEVVLSMLTRDVLSVFLGDFHSGKLQGSTGITPDGYAIEIEKLAGYGVDVQRIIGELHQLGWLYTPADKPGKKIHSVKLNGKSISSILLKEKVARDLGMIKS